MAQRRLQRHRKTSRPDADGQTVAPIGVRDVARATSRYDAAPVEHAQSTLEILELVPDQALRMRPFADLHEQVVDVDAEREVGVHDREQGRRRHNGRRPPRHGVRVTSESCRQRPHAESHEALGDERVAFVDADVAMHLRT